MEFKWAWVILDMDRKLREEEKRFIEEAKAYRLSVPTDVAKENSRKNRKANFSRKMRSIFRARNFAIFFMSISIIVASVFLFNMLQWQSVLGSENLAWVLQNSSNPEVTSIVQEMGMSQLLDLLSIYQNRWFILAGIITAGIVLSALSYIIEITLDIIRDKKESQ